ncbi:hypothetical protein M3664_04365 [Paenibacillus lautus]|uniref:hypothetical protein n=1 Tax=Paenibacillus lautus TaxID=1401 RepID=UPI00203FF931|nr:hypothetical protein [Paenibacillus lautus]MCM3257014.1 hypothetical protein [Paenibacillus lautus]
MLKRNGIIIKIDQSWTIGKGTQKLVRESNGLDYDIGNEVYIISFAGFKSLITVQDKKTGLRFDIKPSNLGKLISK